MLQREGCGCWPRASLSVLPYRLGISLLARVPRRVAKKLRLLAKSQRRHGITSLHLALMTGGCVCKLLLTCA